MRNHWSAFSASFVQIITNLRAERAEPVAACLMHWSSMFILWNTSLNDHSRPDSINMLCILYLHTQLLDTHNRLQLWRCQPHISKAQITGPSAILGMIADAVQVGPPSLHGTAGHALRQPAVYPQCACGSHQKEAVGLSTCPALNLSQDIVKGRWTHP